LLPKYIGGDKTMQGTFLGYLELSAPNRLLRQIASQISVNSLDALEELESVASAVSAVVRSKASRATTDESVLTLKKLDEYGNWSRVLTSNIVEVKTSLVYAMAQIKQCTISTPKTETDRFLQGYRYLTENAVVRLLSSADKVAQLLNMHCGLGFKEASDQPEKGKSVSFAVVSAALSGTRFAHQLQQINLALTGLDFLRHGYIHRYDPDVIRMETVGLGWEIKAAVVPEGSPVIEFSPTPLTMCLKAFGTMDQEVAVAVGTVAAELRSTPEATL
jgi:hypothetical protein